MILDVFSEKNDISLVSEKGKMQFGAKLSPICLSGLIALGSISVAHAAIVADGGVAGQHPSISTGANGSTVVNINAAGTGGISHNIYTQFDVDKAGVVLNNSATGANTQLAGEIGANTNLSGGSAKIILNEVNSRDPSRLNGMIEVAGKQAQVVIANASGITCSGCGFVNAERATLTTGKAQIVDGVLQGYKVEKGNIVINDGGLKSTASNYTNLIARSVQINAEVWAKNLKVTAGRNQTDADNSKVTALSAAGGRPQFGVDVSKLGGMYADKITLLGTERGVGVRNAGVVGAVSDVVMSVNGILDNSNGTIAANHMTKLSSTGVLNNTGGTISSLAGVTLDTNKTRLINNKGVIASNGFLDINSGQLDNIDGQVKSMFLVNINTNGQVLNNTGGNNGSGIFSGVGTKITAGNFNNQNGLVNSYGSVDVTTSNFNNQNGLIDSSGNVGITTGGFNNQNGIVNSSGSVAVTTRSVLNNSNGKLSSIGDMNILTNNQAINNNNGVIESGNTMSIKSGELNNVSGKLKSATSLDINTNGGNIINRGREEGAGIFSGTSTTLTVNNLTNNGGQISSKGDINILNAAVVSNLDGRIEGDGRMILKANRLENREGGITMGRDSNLNISTLNNVNGVIGSKGTASFQTNTINNSSGVLAGDSLLVKSNQLNNDSGLIIANKSADINATTIYNRRSANFANNMGQHIELPEQEGGIIGRESLKITGNNFYNVDGLVASTLGNVMMNQRTVDNTRGIISSVKALDLTSSSLNNSRGTVSGTESLSLVTGSLNNSNGVISSLGAADIRVNSTFTNYGIINGKEGLNVNVQGTLNNYGKLISDRTTTLTGQRFYNQRNAITTGLDGVNLKLNSDYTNRGQINGEVTKIKN